ncbi:MAG: SPASM domain-containing protein [bacterium]|nr:SPASM domain-containing protein [bacterium]
MRPENLTSYIFGNILERSIEEIWQSEKARWYRNQVPEPCLECVELPHCRGGCRPVTIEYGLEGDRLMKEPIREAPVETIELGPAWKPVPHFTIRKEPFGYILCRVNWSVPVTHDAKPLVDAIDGEHTLAQLQHRFGDEALDFIGQLYREGCIGFE